MRRLTAAASLAAALILAIAGSAGGAPPEVPPGQDKKTGTVDIQLLTVSDWHGQLTSFDIDPGPATVIGGGAAVLKAYFDQARAANPNTLTFMAGDSIGATPPISSFFEDEPAIRTMNMMGVTADTFGNHNFDRGVDHLQRMIDLAEFDFVSANLRNVEENLTGVDPWSLYHVDGVKVAVIGITNEEAPELVTPGALGTIEITDSVEAANKRASIARRAGAQVVVILTHKGIRGFENGTAFGELVDFANAVDPSLVDVILGDHTNFTYSGLHNGVLAVENLSKGAQFAKIQLTVDRAAGVTAKSVTFHAPVAAAVTPDPAIQAYIDELNALLAPILGTVIGTSTKAVPRADQCGRADGRLCESLVGNVVTDAMRTTYGTDFALTNAGGLRADLTCPGAGSAGFCPSTTTPPFPITRGGVLGVLPFGNQSTTTTVTGVELKAFLENGVSSMPSANGRFSQVSGMCFTYDIALPPGSRVTSVVRQAADGTCTATAVALTAGSSYSMTVNDFIAAGGDGYPNVIAKSTTRNIMDQDVADYITANTPISPVVRAFPGGRINCADSNGATAPNCPTLTPSP
jgi:2',3'-cyclic-nucleotide 2'-phosphodiesterase (5'-nucleotidase family)